MRKQKLQKNIVEQWRTTLVPEEKRKKYLESIPAQVSASMAFEGEPVDLTMLEQYMESLKAWKDKKGK
ncbi:MAG: hypothetical protein AB1632_14910 [Nitrospirota bacterium]